MIKIKLSKGIYFFPDRHQIIINGIENKLEKKQSDLLLFFINNENVIFSKLDILNNVWGTVVSEHVVSQAIFNLRKIFKESDVKSPIITISKKGYTYDSSFFDVVNRKKTTVFLWSNYSNIYVIILILFIFSMLNISFIERYKYETCQIVSCSELIYLDFNSSKESEYGILRLLKWHFSASNYVHFSSTKLAKELSNKKLMINFDNNEIKYIDNDNKDSSFVFKYGGYLNKHDFINLMVKLEESILIKYRHEEINEIYLGLPNNQESFELFLSTIGSELIFSNINISKLNLAHGIEDKNQYIISYRYLLRLFNLYYEYEGSKDLTLEISKINKDFLRHMKHVDLNVYNVVVYEAFAAYYLSINKPYKSLEFLERIKFRENTFIGFFINAKVHDVLSKKSIAKSYYLKLSHSISESDFEIMSKSFPQSDLGVTNEIEK
ncbi:winged helix-turn-helix domain-containing protein [Aliivibrio fischeri]|uniref:winged helix-turn-helix domain-containing protein n=1 Tax=Aliivibrio fischeri TaxID=668 RepID=UPI00080E8450|nr:winged helix-turn-helix domain-containing protein [Aliivibrio fischeri]OCH03527.1 hypothetical protein A6E09_05145 [Aliivibrio fischeri]OCH11773.1 hypothetical protein A6E11_00935 [Aliivibrio fischeri]OCH30426.1 hypothetical protein A6E13_04280 [Aliivibrio fischeri]